MEEDTKNDQEQLPKEQSLLSSWEPSREVRLFSLYLSAIGIIACIFLLVRAYVYQRHGLRFTYAEGFISEKLFQGYEGTVFIYMSCFLQGIALNSSIIEKYPDTIGKISKFLMIASMFIFFPSLWFYCSSTISELKIVRYILALALSVYMILNIFSSNGQIEKKPHRETSILCGCIIGTFLLFIKNFVEVNF
jgi:hypothetical protein